MAGGLPPDTPAAAVSGAPGPSSGPCGRRSATLGDADLASPSVIVVGAVAGQDLRWFEARPLFGRRVVVTRPGSQASRAGRPAAGPGRRDVEVPVIEIGEPADGGAALAAAAAGVADYDWLVFTSANGVERCLRPELPATPGPSAGVRVAAIGPGTAGRAGRTGGAGRPRPRAVRGRVAGRGLSRRPGGGRVLLPRAAVARDALPDGLRAKGWTVDVVEAYRTGLARPSAAALALARPADAVTFTSSSTVTNYLEVMAGAPVPPVVACIGPITAQTARDAGLPVHVVADDHSIDGLGERPGGDLRPRGLAVSGCGGRRTGPRLRARPGPRW